MDLQCLQIQLVLCLALNRLIVSPDEYFGHIAQVCFKGGTVVLIALVPGHCLPFNFYHMVAHLCSYFTCLYISQLFEVSDYFRNLSQMDSSSAMFFENVECYSNSLHSVQLLLQ